MSRFHSYINTSEKIIDLYRGDVPFSIFIKSYFATNKKFGSKDRKQISELCFIYFRLSGMLDKYLVKEKILTAFFLYNSTPTDLMQAIKPAWNSLISLPITEKMKLVHNDMQLADIFPFKEALSSSINFEKFCLSFIAQPQLFVRVRPALYESTIKKIKQSLLPFSLLDNNCIQLPSGTNIETFLLPDKEVVIQDYNSQKVLDFLKTDLAMPVIDQSKGTNLPAVWDCCAASGGKSILLYDLLNGKCDLNVSDIRPSILSNLHQRFKRAGINKYQYFTSDITNDREVLKATNYDIIICDAPCTGSGTWSRTPEQLHFFKESSIEVFNNKQKKIVQNTLPHLKPGGLLFYITCSVFEQENDAIVHFIKSTFNLQVLQQQYLYGYEKNADSMFVAVCRKPQ